ncbi:Nin1 binding protein [Kappamyces sp. JEL0680]|nr:Nin1 binding protein [Kappamyces sp. JEL0680]
MKLSLLSTDGMLIRNLRSYVLRCHACFKTTSVMDKTFCPSCGNNTLLKVTVGVDSEGKMTMYLKKNFQHRNRGTVYSIPAPKGGRHSQNLILREDQNEHHKALLLQKRFEKKVHSQEADMDSLLFFGQSMAGLSVKGTPIIGYGRKNPNEVRGRRRK